jgi:hypothetical protein
MIIGDSWGVPNYPPTEYIKAAVEKIRKNSSKDVEINVKHLGDPPETHLEFLLRANGYDVINFSKNGGSNLDTIRRAKQFVLENNIDVHWLIWFHTESLRDRNEILVSEHVKFSMSELTTKLAVLAYQEFSNLVSMMKCRCIVIGGQAPVLMGQFREIVGVPDMLIEDWHSEILGIELPFSHGVCNLDLFESPNCIDSIEEKTKMLNDIDTVLRLDYESDDFPDNAHPGKHAHKRLFDKISTLICQDSQ